MGLQQGIERLLGKNALTKLQQSKAMVVGLGGVGSWAAEALARSSIGELVMMDLDDVCLSNSNRQLHALHSTVGQSKIEVLAKRFFDINPEIKITLIHDFFTKENASTIFPQDLDLVIDAIDGLSSKCALSAICFERKIPIVVCGGVGGIRSPQSLRMSDLAHATRDQLLYRMRKKLRADHGFPEGKRRGKGPAFGIPAIFADEDRVFPDGKGDICLEKPESVDGSKMDCYQGLGSAVYVSATMGMMAASVGIDQIIQPKLDPQ